MRVNISGCTNSCGQHHVADIGFFGLERRAHGRAAPGYQMLLGGHLGDMQIEFGDKASKLPAKSAPEAVVRIVGQFNERAQRGRDVPAVARPLGWRQGRRPDRSRISTTSPPPKRAPSSSSTTARPVPTSRRSATASARNMSMLEIARSRRPLVDVDLGELAAVSAELEGKPASAAVKWAWERFGTGVVLAASFQDCVLIDVAVKAVPDIEVVFLDTQYHFAETHWYVERVRERYDLNLTIMEPLIAPDDLWQTDPDVSPEVAPRMFRDSFLSSRIRSNRLPRSCSAMSLNASVGPLDRPRRYSPRSSFLSGVISSPAEHPRGVGRAHDAARARARRP